jgi:hypothetical protein
MRYGRSLLLVIALGMLVACTTGPGPVTSPAETAALAEGDPRNVGKEPRKALWQKVRLVQAISFCYGSPPDAPGELVSEAQAVCKGGTVDFVGQDTYLAECPLFQPHRVTFMCYPGPEEE